MRSQNHFPDPNRQIFWLFFIQLHSAPLAICSNVPQKLGGRFFLPRNNMLHANKYKTEMRSSVDNQLDRSSCSSWSKGTILKLFNTYFTCKKHVCCLTLKTSSQSKESSSPVSTTLSTADHSMAIIIGNSTEDQPQWTRTHQGTGCMLLLHLWMNLNWVSIWFHFGIGLIYR
jgi:hypothetical protein